jgi:hypothetical protein
MLEISNDGRRASLLDSSGQLHRASFRVLNDGTCTLRDQAVSREDLEDMAKAIQNYLRTGYFDGRVRT